MRSKSIVILVNSEKTMKYDHPSGIKQTRYAHTPKIVNDAFAAISKDADKSYLPQMVVFDPKVETKFGGMSYNQLESGVKAYSAIHKAIDVGMGKATSPAPVAAAGDSFLGTYEKVPPTNDRHHVTIEAGTKGKLRWKNRAGVSWTLEFRKGNELWAAKDCPYGEKKYAIKKDKAGKFTGLQFGEDFYRFVAGLKAKQN